MMSRHPHRRFFQLPWRSAERIRREVDEELDFELDMRTQEFVRQGIADDEARRRALVEFGDIEQTRRYCAESDIAAQRSDGRSEWLSELRHDARLAWRGMRRTPGFAIVVLVTLALGIGANTAVFSVVRKVVIDELPYENPNSLVRIYGATVRNPRGGGLLTAEQVADLRESPMLKEVAPFGFYSGRVYTGEQSSEMWQGVTVGPEFFHALGVHALLGRTIDSRDVTDIPAPVVVLAYRLWLRSFGGDSSVVGRDVLLDGHPLTVIGVLPADFVFPESNRDPEILTPLDVRSTFRGAADARRLRSFRVLARMRDGVTPSQLGSSLAVLSERARARNPELADDATLAAVSMSDALLGQVRPLFLLVMGAALMVLLIACVNVAGLFLSRAITRRRELAVRAALGAGRARLVRQLLTESSILGLAGGALGAAMAIGGNRLLARGAAVFLPTMGDVPVDTGVLAFALGLAITCALAFGIGPALVGTHFRLQGSLGEAGRTTGGHASSRAASALVIAQVALAVVLLIAAGLLGRTLITLERVGLGFDTKANLLTFGVSLPSARYADASRQVAFFDALRERIEALPGVRSSAAVTVAPWNGYTTGGPDSLFANGIAAGIGDADLASAVTVTDDYFATMGIPIRAGREFTTGDRGDAALVAVVSDNVARRFWPGKSPIGQQIRLGGRDAPLMEIVGVAGDVRANPDGRLEPTVYVPMRQHPRGGTSVVIRASGDAIVLVPAIRRALHDLDPGIPLVQAQTLKDKFADMLGAETLTLALVASFAALALLLAALGVYSVMAYSVGARHREFGIRSALGAQRKAVLALVLRQGITMALAGTVLGLILAIWVTRLLSSFLVGVAPRDPLTFASIALTLLAVSAFASFIPARRAMRADPVEALRAE